MKILEQDVKKDCLDHSSIFDFRLELVLVSSDKE